MNQTNNALAKDFFAVLKRTKNRVVLAESCTAGRIAATLGEIPGVSSVLTGSAVVYQELTKCRWLGVNAETIAVHGIVSEAVSIEMAEGVLRKTPHATIGASITGHLGPDAPKELDGIAWTAVSLREESSFRTVARRIQLEAGANDLTGELRIRRIEQAVEEVLRFTANWCEEQSTH